MKYILGRSRPQSRLGQLVLVIILAVAAPLAKAGGVDFKQASNKNPALGNVIWINSILQQNNSRYFEGLSTLQRMVLLDIPPAAGGASPNSHTLTFGHEASKSGFHAYDFLTSWEQARAASIAYSGSDVFAQLNPDGENLTSGSTGDIIRQLREGPYRIAVSAPTNMGTVEGDDVQARANAYAVKFGERVIRLYGDAPILSAELKFTGYSGSSDQFAEYTLIWESASSNLLVEMAGHLAVGGAPGNALGYGPGRGSSSISGGPYHFKLAALDDASLGSQDNQIKGADIQVPPPVVQITPSVQSICIGSGTAEFTANVVADGAAPFSYAWTGPNGFTSNAPTISISAAGTYSVVVTGTNGLGSLAVSAVLTVNPLPVVSIKAPVITCSKSQVELIAESTATNLFYRWSGPGVVSSVDAQTVTVNQPGEYSVVATDPNGCSVTTTVSVLENKVQPAVVAEGGTLTCANPEIRLSASSATLGALFQWSGPGIVSDADTATPRVNKGGTYQVIITDPANGCSASATAVVTENKTKPEVRLTGGTLTCEHLQISLSAVSSLPDSLFTWAGPGIVSGANSANPVVNQPGDYVAIVLNPVNGCSTIANVSVQENKVAPVITASGGVLTCSQKEIRLSATSSATGAKYLWSGPGIVAGADTPSPMVNKTGEYTVTVQDSGNGCSSTAVAIVTENLSAPVVSVTGATLTCDKTQMSLHVSSVTAGATFRWSGPGIVSGAETDSPLVNLAGVYSVTVTDPANGCVTTASVTVTEDKQPPVVSATGGTLICAEPKATLRAVSSSPSSTFLWTGPGIVSGKDTATPLVNQPGLYIVVATDPRNGCSATATAVVTENKTAPEIAVTGGTLTCATPELVLHVTCTSPEGCTSTNKVSVASRAACVFLLIDEDSIDNTEPGYFLPPNTGRGVNGVVFTDLDVNDDRAAVGLRTPLRFFNNPANFGRRIIIRSGQVGDEGLFALKTVPNSWGTAGPTTNGLANFLGDPCSPFPHNVGLGLGRGNDPEIYLDKIPNVTPLRATELRSLVGQTVCGLVYDSDISVNYAPLNGNLQGANLGIVAFKVIEVETAIGFSSSTLPLLTIEIVDPCGNLEAPTLFVNAPEPASLESTELTFLWQGPGIISGADTANPKVNQPGEYIVTAVNPVTGCSTIASVLVQEDKTLPELTVSGGALTCAQSEVALRAACQTLGVTFSWAGPGILSGADTAQPTVNAPGMYLVTVTDPRNGCSSVGRALVVENKTSPDVLAEGGVLTCARRLLNLHASSAVTNAIFAWSGPGIVSGAQTDAPLVNLAGVYSVTVTDPANGCATTASVTVTEDKQPPVVSATGGTLTCAEPKATLRALSSSPSSTFLWAGPGIVSGNDTATPSVNQPGTYSVVITDERNGCSATATAVVSENKTVPEITVTGGTLTCANPQISVRASSAAAGALFQWTGPGILTGADTATPTVNMAGTYQVMVTDPLNGCSATATAAVNENKTVPVVATAGGTLTCAKPELVLNASSQTAGAAFAWTGPGIVSGADASQVTVNAPGNYVVTVTDPANGCSSMSTAVVLENKTTPSVTATGGALTCAQQVLSLHASSSITNGSFMWTGPGILAGADSASPTVNAPGIYTVVVTDPDNGCAGSTTATVTQDTSTPAVTAQGAVLTCSQTQAVISASVTKPGMTCLWRGPGIVSGADSGNCVVNAAGIYSIAVTDPATGCTIIESVLVTKESPGVVTLACAASSGQVGVSYNSSLVASGGVPPYTFSIIGGSLPTGMTLTPTTGALTGVPTEPGSFGFTAQVVDSNGSCASSTAVNCEIIIIGNGGYRVTGGSNRGTNMFQAGCITTALPTHVSHGGQVGAAYSVATPFSPNSECISGAWQHNRHLKGNSLVGNLHAAGNGNVNQFDSLLGACLPCPEDLGAVGVVGGVCNPGSRTCGPEPRRAPANKICFSGVGDYTFTTGNKTVKAVFRVDIEDRGEGGSQLPDRYRIRIWLLDPSCGRNADPDSAEAMALRYAASADPDKIAVLATTEDLKVNIPPDIDDGGNMTQGNHQIHPETGAHCGESAHNAPSLKTTRGPGGTIIAMWPAVHSNYVLQTSSSMTSANWVNVTAAPVVLKNKCIVTNAISNGIQFFRLIKP